MADFLGYNIPTLETDEEKKRREQVAAAKAPTTPAPKRTGGIYNNVIRPAIEAIGATGAEIPAYMHDTFSHNVYNPIAEAIGRATGYQFLTPATNQFPAAQARAATAREQLLKGVAGAAGARPYVPPPEPAIAPATIPSPETATQRDIRLHGGIIPRVSPVATAPPQVPAVTHPVSAPTIPPMEPVPPAPTIPPALDTSRINKETVTFPGGQSAVIIRTPTTDLQGRSLRGIEEFYKAIEDARKYAPYPGDRDTWGRPIKDERAKLAIDRANAIATLLGQGNNLNTDITNRLRQAVSAYQNEQGAKYNRFIANRTAPSTGTFPTPGGEGGFIFNPVTQRPERFTHGPGRVPQREYATPEEQTRANIFKALVNAGLVEEAKPLYPKYFNETPPVPGAVRGTGIYANRWFVRDPNTGQVMEYVP